MKLFILSALIFVSASCGKKEIKKNELRIQQQESQRNPHTGQIEILRARLIDVPVYINETEQIMTIFENRTHSPNGEGHFSCHAYVRAGARMRYNLLSGGKTLSIPMARQNQYFDRNYSSRSVLGEWTQVEYRDGLTIKTTMTFPTIRTMNLLVECSRR